MLLVIAHILLWAEWVGLAAAAAPYNRTIRSVAIVVRHGERTPDFSDERPLRLTPRGAMQLEKAGADLRRRYIVPPSLNGTGAAFATAAIEGLSAYTINNDHLYAISTDDNYVAASAQALIQGLYPPVSVDSASIPVIDSNGIMSNRTYVENPVGGYQYPLIRTVSSRDPQRVYVSGTKYCPQYDNDRLNYISTDEFRQIDLESQALYRKVGNAILTNVLDSSQWGYASAYEIYDYVNYMNEHDTAVAKILASNDFAGVLDQLLVLANRQVWAMNRATNGTDNAAGIRAIAGRTLMAKVQSMLYSNIFNRGANDKLSLIFGEHEPFLAFFSLARLADFNSNFEALPAYGSIMAFELFSIDKPEGSSLDVSSSITQKDTSPSNYPDMSNLYVRFLFRNGTADDAQLQAYPLFGRGPSEFDMPWSDFSLALNKFSLAIVGTWCTLCSAYSVFCDVNSVHGSDDQTWLKSQHKMTTQAAGVLGVGLTLTVLVIASLVAALCGGIRLSRDRSQLSTFPNPFRSSFSTFGSFKGGTKMASDLDLILPKHGTDPGISQPAPTATVNNTSQRGRTLRERVGSWQMHDKEASVAGISDVALGLQNLTSVESFGIDAYSAMTVRPATADERV